MYVQIHIIVCGAAGLIMEYAIINARIRSNFINYEQKLVNHDGRRERIRAISGLIFDLLFMALLILSLTLLGALYYYQTQDPENWSYFFSVYFCVMIISNVG